MTMTSARAAIAVTIGCVLFGSACRSSNSSPAPGANTSSPTASNPPVATSSPPVVKSRVDICNLLSSDDLKGVQGEAYKDAQRSDRVDGDFVVAQCYYAMPTTVNSVVVNVTTAKEEAGARSPRVLWEQTFGGDEEKERAEKGEREREPDKAKDREREKEKREKEKPRERGEEGEEKEGSPPERVKALGDEAFWVGSPVGGALYVLKNDLFIRISIGGAGTQQARLAKSKTVAQKILQKL